MNRFSEGDIRGTFIFVKEIEPYIRPDGRKERKGIFRCQECQYIFESMAWIINSGKRRKCACNTNSLKLEIIKKRKDSIDKHTEDVRKSREQRIKRESEQREKKVPDVVTKLKKRRMTNVDDGSQAQKVLDVIHKQREGKRFRMVQIDRRTWREEEIKD
jgi:rubrerythrin